MSSAKPLAPAPAPPGALVAAVKLAPMIRALLLIQLFSAFGLSKIKPKPRAGALPAAAKTCRTNDVHCKPKRLYFGLVWQMLTAFALAAANCAAVSLKVCEAVGVCAVSG